MKKKHFIGLSTLLLVFLLGLSTTSYADVNRTWTDIELKNILYKMAMNNNPDYSSTYVNLINSKSTEIQTIVNELNEYDFNAVGAMYDNSTLFIKITNLSGWYVYRNQPVTVTSFYKVYTILLNNNNISISSSSTDTSSSWIWGDYRYIGRNTYNNSSWEYIVWGAGEYYPDNFFDEWYYHDVPPFTFIPKPSDETADVYYFEDIPLYNASGEDLYLGQLFDPFGTNIVYWTKDNYYYRFGDWNMRQLPVDSIYLEYFTTDNDVAVYDVYLQSKYIYENTIYSSVWADGSTEPYTLAYTNFYVKNNNTIVANGVVDVSRTFSGDYKDEYDSIIDNQQDVNNISEAIDDTILDDSEVDNMLSGFNTSGDILNTLGYSPIENPFSSVILRVIQALNDVLLGSGDVTLNLSAFELDMEINSSDFTLPNGLIKNFVSLVSNGFMIWVIYKYGFKLYMMINTGKFKNLIDETTNTNVNLF